MASEPWAGEGGLLAGLIIWLIFRHLDGDGLPSSSTSSFSVATSMTRTRHCNLDINCRLFGCHMDGTDDEEAG